MNGKQLVKALEKFDDQMADAYSEGEDFPVIESVVPVDAVKVIRRKYGDVPAQILEGINEKVEALNEAMAELDHDLEVAKYIAKGLADTEELAQQVADQAPSMLPNIPEPALVEDDGNKVKGD